MPMTPRVYANRDYWHICTIYVHEHISLAVAGGHILASDITRLRCQDLDGKKHHCEPHSFVFYTLALLRQGANLDGLNYLDFSL